MEGFESIQIIKAKNHTDPDLAPDPEHRKKHQQNYIAQILKQKQTG
jgi:hypothetical protein